MYKKIKKIFVREIITALQANNYRVNLIVVHVCESIRVVGVCVCVQCRRSVFFRDEDSVCFISQ